MSIRSNLKVDFSKWSKHPAIHQLTQQISNYEKKVSTLVKDFDLKSKEARERSRKQLDKVLVQLKETRSKVEKKVTDLVNMEGEKLNKRVNELVTYMNQIARKESQSMANSAGRAKNTGRTKKAARKTTTRARKTRAK
jgi:hypothetical protein